jgi:hypothetical protein
MQACGADCDGRTAIQPLRSFLFAPGNHARRVEKALSLDADAVILDLEDAVATAEKRTTRGPVRCQPGRRRRPYTGPARPGPLQQRNKAPRRLDRGGRCQTMTMSPCSAAAPQCGMSGGRNTTNAGFISGRSARARSERVRSIAGRSSRCRSQGNKILRRGSVRCPSRRRELLQSCTRWRQSRRSVPV